MTRQEAARNATAVRLQKRERAKAIDREILSLRRQIGQELASASSAGARINLGNIDEEQVPELKTLSGRIPILERMANDPKVRAQLRAITATMLSGVRWRVEGGTPEMQDFVAANLLREGPRRYWCSTSWAWRMQELLGCLIHGFSMFAKNRTVVDGKIIFRDLTWLHPRSIDEDGWVMDESDNLLGVRRSYMDATGAAHSREEIPSEDLAIFPWDARGPNWEGNAFIRPMYKPWKLRELAEKINIIDLQNRGVGIPMAKLSGAGGAKERDTLVEILKSLRGGSKERAFIVLEKDEDVTFLTTAGNVKDAQPTIDAHGSDIAGAAGGQYLESGNTSTGSRAVGSVLATGFFIQVDAIRVIIEDMINNGAGRQLGLVEELGLLNFDGYDDIDDPLRLVGSRVSPTEQLDNVPLIGDSVQKGVIPQTLKLANHVSRALGAPELTEEEYQQAKQSNVVPFGGGQPGNGGAGRPPEAGQDPQGRSDGASRRFGLREEKKSPDAGTRPMKNVASWPWLGSNPS